MTDAPVSFAKVDHIAGKKSPHTGLKRLVVGSGQDMKVVEHGVKHPAASILGFLGIIRH